MKTIITSITATVLLSISLHAHSQAINTSNKHAAQAEGVSNKAFNITGTSIQPGTNGITVTWEANNQFNIARYELQLSENNHDFSTVKRKTSGTETNVKYQVSLTNTVILASPVYFRIKVVTLDGQVSYTESKTVRIEEI
jgi:5-methylcytosine-specific restriction endonuclease McrBC GTP-binding regulatory subunit McrB